LRLRACAAGGNLSHCERSAAISGHCERSVAIPGHCERSAAISDRHVAALLAMTEKNGHCDREPAWRVAISVSATASLRGGQQSDSLSFLIKHINLFQFLCIENGFCT